MLRRRLAQVEARANELLAMVGEREEEVEMVTAELKAQEIADKGAQRKAGGSRVYRTLTCTNVGTRSIPPNVAPTLSAPVQPRQRVSPPYQGSWTQRSALN